MVNYCCAFNCHCTSDLYPQLMFHKFPDAIREKERRQKWINAVKRKNFEPGAGSKICSRHFKDSDYLPPVISGPVRLKKEAVPSIFDFPKHLLTKEKPGRKPPTTRSVEIDKENIEDILVEPEERAKSVAVQTTLTMAEIDRTLVTLRREKKCLQQQLNRRNRRVSNLGDMILLLKNNNLLDDNTEGLLKSNFRSSLPFELYENELENVGRASTSRRYSDSIKEFCLTLHFYSPKAYNFLRRRSILPDESTIRRWLSSRDCKPGILEEVLSYLKEETVKQPFLRDVALVYDAMSIRAGRWYCKKEDKYYGYVDLGGIVNSDTSEYATEALFFVIVSYTHKFKCPVAYFLINKINATLQAQLVSAVITSLHSSGVLVRSLTSDGTSTNLNTYEKLGCRLDVMDIQSFFPHPNDNSIRIHCLLDPSHAIKLARNVFGECSLSSDAGCISFNYLRRINDLQNKINFKLANKLSNSHIFYKRKKMKVNLAVQVISSRVADTLQYLKSEYAEFKDAGATIEFIRIFDRLFDYMNSRNKFASGYKAPLRLNNRQTWIAFFSDVRTYIKTLQCDGIPLLSHRRKTFALGFYLNTFSYTLLALDLLQKEHPLEYFLAYKTSQDHGELTFSCIRCRTGQNNNPHALQLSWILRKMLFRNSITPTKNSNCVNDKESEHYFGIFSFGTSCQRDKNRRVNSLHENNVHNEKGIAEEERIDDIYAKEIGLLSAYEGNISLIHLRDNALYFVAGSIVKKYFEKYSCSECEACLLNNNLQLDHAYTGKYDVSAFTYLKNRGGLLFVSNFAMDVVTETEKLYQRSVGTNMARNIRRSVIANVRRHFIMSNTLQKLNHPVFDTSNGESHEMRMLNFIASNYLLLRIYTQCKKATQDFLGFKSHLRQHLRHVTLFSNT